MRESLSYRLGRLFNSLNFFDKVAVAILLLAVVVWILLPSEKSPKTAIQTVAVAPELREDHKDVANEYHWQYADQTDKMGRGTIKFANVSSLNEISFDSPNRGNQHGTLRLQAHPKFGKDVILMIENGQFICRPDGCQIAVRFDDGKPSNYNASLSSGSSDASLFIHRDYDSFVSSVRNAKKVYIEAQFFQQGTRVFEFDVSGLKW